MFLLMVWGFGCLIGAWLMRKDLPAMSQICLVLAVFFGVIAGLTQLGVIG